MRMIDISKGRKYRVETWESNKGQLGFKAWALWLWIPEVNSWYKLDGSKRHYPLHPDNADRIASEIYERALEGSYEKFIQGYIYGEDEAGE